MGLIIAWIGVKSTSGESNISWAIFLIIIYPATELIFSFFRRIYKKKSPFYPDSLHLHSILFGLFKNKFTQTNVLLINSCTGIFLVLLNLFPASFTLFNKKVLTKLLY